MDLNGKVALVTGAARGIEGCDVALADIANPQAEGTSYLLGSSEDLAITANAVEDLGRRVLAEPVDVTSMAQIERFMRMIEENLGGLDVVVANAAIIEAAPVSTMDERVWDRIFAVNVKGVFLTAQAAIPLLEKRGGGRIVNVASVAGKTGRAGLSAYCASKAAVISFTQALAEELGPKHVAVNALCPGYIRTAMWTKVLNPVLSGMLGVPEDRVFDEFVGRQTYFGREQTPEEIAEGAIFLCRAENVTGITLTVAGGGEVH
jgi:meso-butanediol dehydrogenase/(S,S)-butanediol dehydrogenase/diacetyl reductase